MNKLKFLSVIILMTWIKSFSHASVLLTLHGNVGSFTRDEVQLVTPAQIYHIKRSEIPPDQNNSISKPGAKITLYVPIAAVKRVRSVK